jgi:hypothetical protein
VVLGETAQGKRDYKNEKIGEDYDLEKRKIVSARNN